MVAYEEEVTEPSLSGFLEEIALFTDVDKYEPQQDVVYMMTMHAAKGLEFENVFLVGFEDGVFPSGRSINSIDREDMEEERRLAYVAITRAKQQLHMTNADRRMLFGTTLYNKRSRFLGEINPDLIDRKCSDKLNDNAGAEIPDSPKSITLQQQLADKAKSKSSVSSKFTSGDRVNHNIFGEGTVLAVTPMGNDALIEVAFDNVGTKKLMANFAKIKKITE